MLLCLFVAVSCLWVLCFGLLLRFGWCHTLYFVGFAGGLLWWMQFSLVLLLSYLCGFSMVGVASCFNCCLYFAA